MWDTLKTWVLRPFQFKTSKAALSAIFTLLLIGALIYMKIGDWTMIAFFFSTTLVLVLGTLIEQFKLRHWSLSYLAILSIISSFVSFFLLLVSMLDRFPFVIIGWIVFALPPVINFCYNLFNLVRAPKNVPLA